MGLSEGRVRMDFFPPATNKMSKTRLGICARPSFFFSRDMEHWKEGDGMGKERERVREKRGRNVGKMFKSKK